MICAMKFEGEQSSDAVLNVTSLGRDGVRVGYLDGRT